MRPRISLVLAVVVFAAFATPVSAGGSTNAAAGTTVECGFPFTATDATGTEVTVDSEPQRIVTLSPSAAQTMWEIGGKDKVVGVTKYAAYLEGAETRANISGSGQSFVNVEKVISLEPDLVLAPNVISNDTVAKLREAGLTVYKFPFQTSIDDIKQKTLLMGQLTGECDGAEETVAWMEAELSVVREAVDGQERPPVLYVFFGYTGGEGTFVHRIIETAGGNNIAADANISGYKQISQEIVVKYNPEWIVLNDGATQIPQTEAYNNTYAVQHDQIVVLQEEYISQPAPRIVLSVVTLAKALHPEAYEQAAQETATETATQASTATDTQTQTAVPESTPTTTSANNPGFGVGVAVVAIALTIFLFRRPRE